MNPSDLPHQAHFERVLYTCLPLVGYRKLRSHREISIDGLPVIRPGTCRPIQLGTWISLPPEAALANRSGAIPECYALEHGNLHCTFARRVRNGGRTKPSVSDRR